CLLAIFAAPALGFAQVGKKTPASQLAVDVVTLKSGKTLRGVILRADRKGALSLAVSRAWLEEANLDLFAKATADESTKAQAALQQLQARLKKLLDDPPEGPRVMFFLEQELQRVEKLLLAPRAAEPRPFVGVEVASPEIMKVVRAGPEQQRIALWAWN